MVGKLLVAPAMLGPWKNSIDFKYISGAQNDNQNSTTANVSNFISKKTE